MAILNLGTCDFGKIPVDKIDFLKNYHPDGLYKKDAKGYVVIDKDKFRDDNNLTTVPFKERSGSKVSALQDFLFNAGFMNKKYNDGVFDYVTEAAVRLFQEYLRTIDPEGDRSLIPNGTIDVDDENDRTEIHRKRWEEQNLVSAWFNPTPTKEYNDWMNLLEKAKSHYSDSANQGPILKLINSRTDTYSPMNKDSNSTIKANDWNTDKDQIHLVGIRRKQDETPTNKKNEKTIRKNDDIFIMLINGMVFKFWGSTDPNEHVGSKLNEAFLVEGQHVYRFGWHKLTRSSTGVIKIYRALKPYRPKGVLILRDRNDNDALTGEDILGGLELGNDINIHWSGIGGYNFSAGCQVIAGESYINNNGVVENCPFASNSYSDLKDSNKTKGAYNVLADLAVCYSDINTLKKPNKVYYTLGREESFNIDVNFGSDYIDKIVNDFEEKSKYFKS